ncbi:MAG: DUF4091 domain-containing protein [Armatimonadetes bacterium]|nr:DUF4091 domain-containing protein [Armatimonadota bacterium]
MLAANVLDSLGLMAAVILAGVAMAAVPADLPEAEKAIANTVDPWGLAFSDQLTRFRGRFAEAPQADFCLGVTHDLVKIWPNKYWYRGRSFPASVQPTAAKTDTLWAAAGTTQAFQLAVLPRTGAPAATYEVSVELADASGQARVGVFREVFVHTPEPAYPRYNTDRWPDPLVPETRAEVAEGLDCAVFWVDVHLPATMSSGEVVAHVRVADGKQECRVDVPIRVVGGLELKPKAYPFVGWFRRKWGGGTLSEEQYRGLCDLVLAHHMMPVDALRGLWKADDPSAFDAMHDFLAQRGQTLFDIGRADSKGFDALYQHVKAAGWLDQAIVYSNADEPDDETFREKNIAYWQMVHSKYPGLRVYLASEWHEDMAKGCDIWMTDLSSHRYDPEAMRSLKQPELWHYYCHLPVRWQMRAPLVLAPNMQIDNPAIEHRLALWMSRYYGAKGVFIWAGFVASGLRADFWQTLTLNGKPSGFPYAGIHNGNNFRVYPPREEGGPVMPSLRLKVTRAGMEDRALLAAAEDLLASGQVKGGRAERLKALLNPVPDLFVDTHYFTHDPARLLGRREAILRLLAEVLR